MSDKTVVEKAKAQIQALTTVPKDTSIPGLYTIMYPMIMQDNHNYMLYINTQDHRWYKAKEVRRWQEVPTRNSQWRVEYENMPTVLTDEDIKYLSGK